MLFPLPQVIPLLQDSGPWRPGNTDGDSVGPQPGLPCGGRPVPFSPSLPHLAGDLLHVLTCLPSPQTCSRAKHWTSLNPNYVMCHSTVVQGGGTWSHTQEWGQKPSWIRATDSAWPLPAVAPTPPASPSTMSGQVGDLSPKQAEGLAKVRAPFPGAPRKGAEGQKTGGGCNSALLDRPSVSLCP